MSVKEQQVTRHHQASVGSPAERLAEEGVDEFSQFVICRVGGEEFAVDVLRVQEINRLADVARVPRTPHYVEGVINLRGRIVPVLDLRKLFGLTGVRQTAHTRIVVVSVETRLVGLMVESVEEVLRIPKSAIEPPPSVGTMAGAEFTQGIGRIKDRLLILVDLNRLLLTREAA
jgi:purine-binding chemotaxis protein CheW